MDTLHFGPRDFDGPGDGHRSATRYRVDDTNLSEVEVFMLRGRRLQAQALGGGLRRAFAKLRGLLRGSDAGSAARAFPHHRHQV